MDPDQTIGALLYFVFVRAIRLSAFFFLSLSLCKEMWNRLPKGHSDRAPVCKGKIRTKLGPFCCEAGNIPQNGEDTVRGRHMEIVIYEMCFIFVDFVDV